MLQILSRVRRWPLDFYSLALALALVLPACGEKSEVQKAEQVLSAANREAVIAALREKGYQPPNSIEFSDSGYLVVKFTVSNPPSPQYLEKFAKETLLIVRNTLYSTSPVRSIRVTLDGPSPGPDLVLRYGSARFTEGGKVEWEPARN